MEEQLDDYTSDNIEQNDTEAMDSPEQRKSKLRLLLRARVAWRHFNVRMAEKQNAIERRIEYKRIRNQRRNSRVPYTHCKNCGTELKGVYCHQCGQYALDLRQSFGSHILEYIANTYQFDQKIIPTVKQLFRRPGFLTNEFMAGKINSYVHPLKLNMFLLLIVMVVFVFSLSKGNSNSAYVDEADETSIPFAIMEAVQMEDGFGDEMRRSSQAPVKLIAPYAVVAAYPQYFQVLENVSTSNYSDPDTMIVFVPQVLIDENILVMYKEDEYRFANNKSIFNDTSHEGELVRSQFWDALQTYLPIVILLLCPLLALFVRLFNIKQKQGFMTHFVFSLHYSAFLEILVFAFLLLLGVMNSVVAFFTFIALTVGTIIYLALAFRRVYKGTSWGAALCKALLVNLLYLLMILASFLGILILFIIVNKNAY